MASIVGVHTYPIRLYTSASFSISKQCVPHHSSLYCIDETKVKISFLAARLLKKRAEWPTNARSGCNHTITRELLECNWFRIKTVLKKSMVLWYPLHLFSETSLPFWTSITGIAAPSLAFLLERCNTCFWCVYCPLWLDLWTAQYRWI